MKTPIKTAVAGFGILLVSTLLNAQELTFNLGSSAAYTDASTDSLVFEGRLSGGLDLPLGGTTRFQLQGGALYNLDALAKDTNPLDSVPADPSAGRQGIEYFFLQQLKLSGRVMNDDKDFKGLGWELGRMYLDDPSRQVFAGTYDGLKLSALFPFGSIDAVLGTTMLLPKREAGITLTLSDLITAANNDDTLASARVFGSLAGNINLGSGQVLKPFFAFQEDANELKGYQMVTPGTTSFSGVNGSALDSQYIGVNLSGAVGSQISYDVSGIFELGRTLSWLEDAGSSTGASYQWAAVYAGLFSTTWNFNLESVLGSTLSTGIIFGTGDPDADSYYEGNTSGDYNQYFSLVANQFSQILSAASGNMAVWNIAWTIRPGLDSQSFAFQNLSASVSLATLFRTSSGALPVEGLASGSDKLYLGEELGLGAVWRPVPDFRLNFGWGLFLPASGDAGAFSRDYTAENPVLMKAKLGFNLYF